MMNGGQGRRREGGARDGGEASNGAVSTEVDGLLLVGVRNVTFPGLIPSLTPSRMNEQNNANMWFDLFAP